MPPISVLQDRLPSVDQDPQPLVAAAFPRTYPLFIQKIAAGFPSPSSDYVEDGLELEDYLINHPASTFFFTVKGQSMREAGILDGDKIVVDRSVEARHGHIVVAILHNEFTLKRLFCSNGVVELRPENPDFQPIRLSEGEALEIWGVAVGVIRKLRV